MGVLSVAHLSAVADSMQTVHNGIPAGQSHQVHHEGLQITSPCVVVSCSLIQNGLQVLSSTCIGAPCEHVVDRALDDAPGVARMYVVMNMFKTPSTCLMSCSWRQRD